MSELSLRLSSIDHLPRAPAPRFVRQMRAVSLERLHLCCKGSCEFVESSLRTVLLRILTTVKFLDSAKTKNRSTARFYNFQKWKCASLSTRPRIHANNWFYSMTCATPTPLFMAVGRGSAPRFDIVGFFNQLATGAHAIIFHLFNGSRLAEHVRARRMVAAKMICSLDR